MLRTKPRPKL